MELISTKPPGVMTQWKRHNLDMWPIGEIGDLVGLVKEHDGEWSMLMETLTMEIFAYPKLDLPQNQKVTLYQIKKSDQVWNSHHCFVASEGTQVFPMNEDPAQQHRCIDVCAGIGGFSVGMKYMGLNVIAALDVNPLMTKAYGIIHDHEAICGDVGKSEVISQLHQRQGQISAIFSFGFPCQPLSRQGDKKGPKDSRSQVLPNCLWAAHLLQSWCLILENVPEAFSDDYVQGNIASFANAHDMYVNQGVLDLHDVWPSRRSRWFAVLLPKRGGKVPFRQFPKVGPTLSVQDVMEEIPCWEMKDEYELKLTDYEMSFYLDPCFTQGERNLELHQILPTALHSWGVALLPCPCGCRKPLAQQRLRNSGLRGVLVKSRTEDKFWRHPHPNEVAFLNGFPPFARRFGTNREELCLLGNMVSPIQVIWLLAEMTSNGPFKMGQIPKVSSEEVLQGYLDMLQFQRRLVWPKGNMLHAGSFECALTDSFGTRKITVAPGSLIEDLKAAEEAFLPMAHVIKVYAGDLEMPDHVLIQAREYRIMVREKKQKRERTCECMVKLVIGMREMYHQITIGTAIMDVVLRFVPLEMYVCFDVAKNQVVPWQSKVYVDSSFRILPTQRASGPAADTSMMEESMEEIEDPDEWMQHSGEDFRGLVKKIEVHLMEADPTPMAPRGQGKGLDSFTITEGGKVLMSMLSTARRSTFWFLEPTLAAELMADAGEAALITTRKFLREENIDEILTMCAVNDHWIAVHFQWDAEELFVRVADAQEGVIRSDVESFIKFFQRTLEIQKLVLIRENILIQQPDHICGALALAHAAFLLGLVDNISYEEVKTWYVTLRWRTGKSFRASGSVAEIQEWLQNFLQEKGVPKDKVNHRVNLAIKTLSLVQLQKAKESNNPWRMLKVLSDKKGQVFRWIQPDELQAVIDDKATKKFSLENQKKPKHKQAKDREQQSTQLQLDPRLLEVHSGTFVDSQGQPLKQIMLEQIQVNARGFALAVPSEIKAWLAAGKSISVDALAVVTTATLPQEVQGCLPHEIVRYAAKVKKDGSPILLTGSLVQLGDDHVHKRSFQGQHQVVITPSTTLKLHLFRDEWSWPWKDIVARPVSQIQQALDPIQICHGQACGLGCAKWHKDVDGPLESPILDVWGWFWHGKDGRKTKAHEAEVFSLLLRVPKELLMPLQSYSGRCGIYIEPRDESGRATNDIFKVIWLSKCTKDEALVQLKSLEHGIALCRMKDKFGIRVSFEKEEEIYMKIFPQRIFVACRPTDVYVLEPFPVGTQKYGVAKLLKEISWAAKPMHPRGSKQGKVAWLVAAQAPPPNSVLETSEGEIVVSWLRSLQAPRRETDDVIASMAVKKKLAVVPPTGVDPWTIAPDPWMANHDRTGGQMSSCPVVPMELGDAAATKIDEVHQDLRSKIIEEVQACLPKAMEEFANTERLDKFEVDLCELRQQGRQFEHWFKEAGEAQRRVAEQLDDLHATQQQQSSCMAAMMENLQRSNQELKDQRVERGQLCQMMESMKTSLQEEFQVQTERIEKSVFNKLPRRE